VIQLFLAHADDHEPVLPGGLPEQAAHTAPPPDVEPPDLDSLADLSAEPDSLSCQRWGVIAPRGPAGEALLQLIAPLKAKREQDQGGVAAPVYHVDPGMDPEQASRWIREEYRDQAKRREAARARYLLVLGGPDAISWDLQQMLAGEAFVGRIAFEDAGGYRAYVDKVLRWEQEAAQAPRAPVLFYTVRDGTPPTTEGYRHLMQPMAQLAREDAADASLDAADLVEIGGGAGVFTGEDVTAQAEEMLRRAEGARAGVLFSMSHGVGVPRTRRWRSPDEQRRMQGAMSFGRARAPLTAADLAGKPFLPGGLWLYFACFGAGTPARSAYHHWLQRLHSLGHFGAAEQVLATLPGEGQPPFVAALPQALLASPEGPLGVIGHVDLAWTWSFLEPDVSPYGPAQSRPERFEGVLRSLARGHRLGVAHHEIARFFIAASAELATMYGRSAQQRLVAEDTARKVRRANLWMERQDLAAFVLLGDPAARLPIAPAQRSVQPVAAVLGITPRPVAAAARGPHDPWAMEAAVLACLRGTEAAPAIAARLGIPEERLERWIQWYREAGRAALAKRGEPDE
jgi:hypothetical protein